MIKNAAEMPPGQQPCPGPMVWFDAGPGAALLECATCGYMIVAGSFYDAAHQDAPLLREGLAQ